MAHPVHQDKDMKENNNMPNKPYPAKQAQIGHIAGLLINPGTNSRLLAPFFHPQRYPFQMVEFVVR